MKKWQKMQIFVYGKVKLSHDFFLYQTLPKLKWKCIDQAEDDTPEAIQLKDQLRKDYQSQDGKTLALPGTINAQINIIIYKKYEKSL